MFFKILNDSAIHISNFLKILIVLLLILLLYQNEKIMNQNWWSAEFEIMRQHTADIWFMYGLDELTIEKGK